MPSNLKDPELFQKHSAICCAASTHHFSSPDEDDWPDANVELNAHGEQVGHKMDLRVAIAEKANVPLPFGYQVTHRDTEKQIWAGLWLRGGWNLAGNDLVA